MSDEYVRKEYYDANVQAIREMIAASEARHAQRIAESEVRLNANIAAYKAETDRQIAENRAETDRQIAELRSDVKEIHAQIASIKRSQDILLGRAGIIIGIITLLYTAAPLITSLIIAFSHK